MSKKLLKVLESEANKIHGEHSADKILDIFIFGSIHRGKEKPNDIDILILFKDVKDLNIAQQLRKAIKKKTDIPVEVTILGYFELMSNSFVAREALLTEGYSLITKKRFSEYFGFKPIVQFHYSLEKKNKSGRMRFYYALHGRNTEGILNKLKAKKFSTNIILCPLEHQEEMQQFFEGWNILVTATQMLIPSRLL